eukprot:m.30218 g.30218  ORF g.30218 m.30218 type:complete len:331 (-) comp4680_c0_seq1:145-1137(-)
MFNAKTTRRAPMTAAVSVLLVTATHRVSATATAAAAPTPPPGFFVQLNDGHMMPAISLGTCCGSDPKVGLMSWIQAGGVGVDTSIDYGDEGTIGSILKQNNVARKDVYITTKVTAGCGRQQSDCGTDPETTLASVNQSLSNLGLDYIDLMLLHRPCQQFSQKCSIAPKLQNCTGPNPIADPTASNNALWQGLAKAQALGLVKSIGVSNYNVGELMALKGPVPAVNQCEMSIQGYDNFTISYCEQHGIKYESYGAMRGCPFSDPTVASIAATHNVSTAQVCLRWGLQRGAVIATGTGNNATTAGAYAKENLDVFGFTLTPTEMDKLNNMQL